MVIQRFCRAYMESPPPAVFHYKYQSYKYERNTAGKSAIKYLARIFCKLFHIAIFWPKWWFKHFAPAYRGFPPPAVFHDKHQSYTYENTAGKFYKFDSRNCLLHLWYWAKRAYAVYWLLVALLYPWEICKGGRGNPFSGNFPWLWFLNPSQY